MIEAEDIAQYIAELTVPEGNKQIVPGWPSCKKRASRRCGDLGADVRDAALGTARNVVLQAGDAIVLEATPDKLDEFRSTLNLALADRDRRPAAGRW